MNLSEIRNRASAAQRDEALQPQTTDEGVFAPIDSMALIDFLHRGPADVLALIAEVERLRTVCMTHDQHTAAFAAAVRERDELRAAAAEHEKTIARLTREKSTMQAERDGYRLAEQQRAAASAEE